MKRLLVLCILTIFVVLSLSAQEVDWLWANKAGGTLDDYGQSIAVDSEGNSYVTGYFNYIANFDCIQLTSNGFADIFIAKADKDGNWLWAKKAGGNGEDYGKRIVVDSEGNSYVTGSFSGTADFGSTSLTSSGGQDIFVAKLDKDGNWLWVKRAGGASYDYGFGITIDSEGNSYVTGYFQSTATFGSITLTSSGSNDIFIAKIDNNGNWLWANRAGGTSSEIGYGIAVDSEGNTYVTGNFNGVPTFGDTSLTTDGGNEIFIAKADEDGNWLWAKKAGGSNNGCGLSIVVDSSGNSYVGGHFEGTITFIDPTLKLTTNGSTDIFIAKADTDGNWLWAKNAGGATTDMGYDIVIDTHGNSYVTGSFQGIATFGDLPELTSSEYDEIFVAKADKDGNWLWAIKAGGARRDYGQGIAIDSENNIYVTGYFGETATFGSSWLTSSGYREIFIAKLVSAPEIELPKSPNNVKIVQSGSDITISWDEVTETTHGTQIEPDAYLVYYLVNGRPYDEYILLGTTSNLNYTHGDITLHESYVLYKVTAYKNPDSERFDIESLGIKRGMSESDVKEILRRAEPGLSGIQEFNVDTE